MAPPPPPTMPLTDRLLHLAKTLQFGWFIGHVTLLLCAIRYGLSWIFINFYSRAARWSYRTAFLAAAATYGIVVYKAYRARLRGNSRQPSGALALAGDENVQYLAMALFWLFARQVPLALTPFMVYSVFHVATYTRTNIIPTLQPSPATSASPGSRSTARASPLADKIGKFVKDYYDSSMLLVAYLEVFLWFRVLGSAIIFTKGSWILLGVYSIFVRARYSQSNFVQAAVAAIGARGDALVANQSTPPAVREGWGTFKGIARQAKDATDINKYVGGQVPRRHTE